MVDGRDIIVTQPLRIRFTKCRWSQRNPFNLPLPLSINHQILSNEDRPCPPMPFRHRLLIPSTSHLFKAASLRQWLVSELLGRQSSTARNEIEALLNGERWPVKLSIC